VEPNRKHPGVYPEERKFWAKPYVRRGGRWYGLLPAVHRDARTSDETRIAIEIVQPPSSDAAGASQSQPTEGHADQPHHHGHYPSG
jgi:hypothetical protein